MIASRFAQLFTQIRRSIWREPWPTDRKGRIRLVLNDLLLHLHPVTVPKRSLKVTYSFGLGGLSILLVVVLAITGVLLMFTYIPTPDQAYSSMESLQTEVWLGQYIRNLHHWSGNLLLILATLHMLRVFYTAAFHAPRQFNWVLGLLLLAWVALSNFTGYLLPWDQLSYWAVTIGAGLIDYLPFIGRDLNQIVLGGSEVGAATLKNFFALHVAVLPVLMIVTLSYHVWRVRKDGFSIPRRVDEPPLDPRKLETLTTVPHLTVLEMTGGLIVRALLLGFGLWRDAPLLEAADPNRPPNPSKAAWYFIGFQELLLHFHPTYVAFFIPALAVAGLLLLPYLDSNPARDPDVTGIWFRSHRGRWLALTGALVGGAATITLVVVDEFWLNLPQLLDAWPTSVSNGLIPLGLTLAALGGMWRLFRSRGATISECNMMLFTLLVVAYLALTVIGTYFRGENWALMWPWEV